MVDSWTDPRNLSAMANSLIVGATVGSTLSLASTLIALAFRWCGLTGNKLIYLLSIVPLIIPDYVFGVAGRVVFDPSIGLLAGVMPETLLINRGSALLLVALVVFIKWLPIMIVFADSAILSMRASALHQTQLDFPSFWRAVRLVYLPELRRTIPIIASLGFLIGFRQHELAYELTSSGGGFDAETWSSWNYRVIFEFAGLARASADGLLALLVLLIPIQVIRILAVRHS